MNFRIGFGYDVHRLKEGLPLILGGVKINFHKGAVAHSDGDALLHAICDALLGAAGLGDIGKHFPDTSPEFKGISSLKLLSSVADMLKHLNYSIVNIDSTVCLEEPKISGFITSMKAVIASNAGIGEDDISIKATTNEKLGYVGAGEGVCAYAVALIVKTGKVL